MSRLWIISGASRGLGAALARAAVEAGDRVLGISRTPSSCGETLCWDLARPQGLGAQLAARLEAFRRSAPAPHEWLLVNNAAILGPIGERYAEDDIEQVMRINLTSPILLARSFVDALADLAAPKRVINLSSGAATRVIRGWSLYSASKAGLDHFGRCLAAEQTDAAHPVDVLNLSPGVIDTGMQEEIRAAGPQGFPDHQRFVALHANEALSRPESVAQQILLGVERGRRHAGATLSLAEFAAG